MKTNIRWMERSDTENVAKIKSICSMSGSLTKHLSSPQFILKVAEFGGEVAGFVRYRNGTKSLRIREIAVAPIFRRNGIATELVRSLISKTDLARKSICVLVPEDQLPAQCMFRKLGFRACEIKESSRGNLYKFVLESKCQKESS